MQKHKYQALVEQRITRSVEIEAENIVDASVAITEEVNDATQFNFEHDSFDTQVCWIKQPSVEGGVHHG